MVSFFPCHFLVPCLSGLFSCRHTAPTYISTLSLHDALPICRRMVPAWPVCLTTPSCTACRISASCAALRTPSSRAPRRAPPRSEEHTSELQSHSDLVCRLLLEKKKHTIDHVHQLNEQRVPAS